jgi:phosphoribosylamine--glycine ligase
MLIAGVIGKDGRTSAISRSLKESRNVRDVVPLGSGTQFSYAEVTAIVAAAKAHRVDYVVVGPEQPLAAGIADVLRKEGIACVGPTKLLAQLESSKAFTRELMREFNIQGSPRYRIFKSSDGAASYLSELGDFVVKPDGLTGGKGVKVSGEHLRDVQEALSYCEELLAEGHRAVIIEERLDGEEFSLQSFCDGTTLVHLPLVQDHKRAQDNDTGPNTGGMGSYCCADGSLPFLRPEHLEDAKAINEAVVQALWQKTGERYQGVLYGGFMATRDGVRLIEYNARLGDPEALNIFSVLRTDFGSICEAITSGTLRDLNVQFESLATVCKYIVPEGYPSMPLRGGKIYMRARESQQLRIYLAAVEVSKNPEEFILTGSRAIAFVGIHEDIQKASDIAEDAASAVIGPVFHRKDIGTTELISRRIQHMNALLSPAPRSEVRI